jgi:predicted nucleotidyltransferase component of viral defense system
MISDPAIDHWSQHAPWMSRRQVEQDLHLSRLIVEIANQPSLADELIFRGGTCLHKLVLPQPVRYSEDLDYVRRSAGGIGALTRALTDLGYDCGYEVSTKIGTHPKVIYRASSSSGTPLRIKIEVNTHERCPALALVSRPFQVDSPWWSGSAQVCTFAPAELIATKLRALYQRKKGRDLFDLWLALTQLRLPPEEILAAFPPYRPEGFTPALVEANLRAKCEDPEFRRDLDLLLGPHAPTYTIDEAAELVIKELVHRL